MRHFAWIFIIFSFMTFVPATVVKAETKSMKKTVTTTPGSRLAISPKDLTCAHDSDCDIVPTKCSCSCGEGVNKVSAPKYLQVMKAMCEANPPSKMCKVKCDGQVKCMDKKCTYVAK